MEYRQKLKIMKEEIDLKNPSRILIRLRTREGEILARETGSELEARKRGQRKYKIRKIKGIG